MKKIAYLTWGCGNQLISFRDFAHYMDDMIYLKDLPKVNLDHYTAVIISCHTHGDQLAQHADQINRYVQNGGFLIVFPVRGIDTWLKGINITWEDKRIKDWLWWTKPYGHIEIYLPNPDHSLFETVTLDDMKWHWHGVFAKGHKGLSLLNTEEDDSLMIDFKELPGGGRILITTLDPHSHNGQRFMPAAMRLTEKFYPWLNKELGIDRSVIEPFKVTYLSASDCPNEQCPPHLPPTFENTPGELYFHSIYKITDEVWQSDVLIVPRICDQFYLKTLQDQFMDYLASGGQIIINTETVVSWLPMLEHFTPVPPHPFTNLKVRVHEDPYGFFNNMPSDFDSWQGIVGQYSRGYSDPPKGAIVLTHVGTAEDPKPSDWLWQYPAENGRGGKIVVHNGDDYHRYPDHGEHKNALLRDICLGLIRHRKHCIVHI